MFILNVQCVYQHSFVVRDLRTPWPEDFCMFTSFITTAARQHNLKLSPQNSSALKHTYLKWHILWGKRVSVHHLSGSSAHKILGDWYLGLDLTTKHMFFCQYFFPSTNKLRITSELFCLPRRPQLCPEHQTKSKPGHFPHLMYMTSMVAHLPYFTSMKGNCEKSGMIMTM